MAEVALLEAFDVQGSTEVVTKSDLIKAIREEGLKISDRNLSYYATEGLIPPAIRVGSRAGVYPAIVVEQLAWVIRARSAHMSIDAIREMLPLWRALVRGRTQQHIDLREVERIARETHLSLEATFRVPFLFTEAVLCLCTECLGEIEWTLQDGTTTHHTDVEPLTINFALTSTNQAGVDEVYAWTQLALPGLAETLLEGPTTIKLDVTDRVAVDAHLRHQRARRRQVVDRRHQEALPLG